ncbi:MAG: DUF2784 domain-containing protein [Syntrophaceae bacterium]|nr:DUF2784 domain-containing protein [Syntrophaceae bacterium]
MDRFFADVLVVLHFLFILFVVAGGILVLHRPRLAILHLPAVIWGAAVELCGWICPLTPLENYFRRLAGGAGYSGGFIEHYLIPLIYPENLTIGMQYVLGALVVVVNLIFYFIIWRKIRIRPQ